MSETLFTDLNLTPKVKRAVEKMGFDYATPIQSEAIPLLRTGADVIAKSQTGTGKTIAFAIPAIEKIDTHEERPTLQVMILCPTRELAQQADIEVKKLARFKPGIRSVAIYGGAPIGKQCIQLRRANMIIGTPGRIMDHMRRKTIKTSQLKMVVLDEADEMLNMGFKEDIETILRDTPETRQTVLFSATMPAEIMKLAKQFQNNARIIEIDRNQKIIGNVEQSYMNVPRERKTDALQFLFEQHKPIRTIVFCNTKKMTDKLTKALNDSGIKADCLHSDIKQSKRTVIMQSFKLGKIPVLVATDIAARGIDVSNVDYVINYDLPQNTEYYIHRIGRTGRAGKSGRSITICTGRSEINAIREIGRTVDAEIKLLELPINEEMQKKSIEKIICEAESALRQRILPECEKITAELIKKGYSHEEIAAAAFQLVIGRSGALDTVTEYEPPKDKKERKSRPAANKQNIPYKTIVINIGSEHKIAANHIVGAITERTALSGSDIGKITVSRSHTVAEIPAESFNEVIESMRGCKIRGIITKTTPYTEK